MDLFKRLKAKTPKRDKRIGRLVTVLGTGCATTLAVATAIGFVFPPTAFVLLTIGSIVLGGKALYHGQKTEEEKTAE
jgi:hypothetical protein